MRLKPTALVRHPSLFQIDRVSRDRVGLEYPIRVSSAEVVANLIKMPERLIGGNIRLRFEPKQGPAAVNADVGTVEQVIMKPAVNARDAMPEGGRTCRSATIDCVSRSIERRRIETRAHRRRGCRFASSVSGRG